MTRVEITIGLLSLLGVIAITAAVGLGEGVKEGDDGRLAKAALGFQKRSVESGAQMFDQYCATCHAFNASGANCPPLDERSGLHGGDLGEGVAWRLEEMHWDRSDVYGYVYSTIAAVAWSPAARTSTRARIPRPWPCRPGASNTAAPCARTSSRT